MMDDRRNENCYLVSRWHWKEGRICGVSEEDRRMNEKPEMAIGILGHEQGEHSPGIREVQRLE